MQDIKLDRKTAEKVANRIMRVKRQSEAGGIQLWVYKSKTTGGIVVFHHTSETSPYRLFVADTDVVPTKVPAQQGTGPTMQEALINALTQEPL